MPPRLWGSMPSPTGLTACRPCSTGALRGGSVAVAPGHKVRPPLPPRAGRSCSLVRAPCLSQHARRRTPQHIMGIRIPPCTRTWNPPSAISARGTLQGWPSQGAPGRERALRTCSGATAADLLPAGPGAASMRGRRRQSATLPPSSGGLGPPAAATSAPALPPGPRARRPRRRCPAGSARSSSSRRCSRSSARSSPCSARAP